MLAICTTSTVISAHALTITTEDNPPFNYLDPQKHVSGISTEILTEMGKRAKIPMAIDLLPWARAYLLASTIPETCVYSTVRLPERETMFKWVGPIASNKWALFAKSDFNKPLPSINDARNYRIGGVLMDGKIDYLKSLGFSNFDLVDDDKLNPGKLMLGRIDLWMSGLYKERELIAQTGATNIKPVILVREVEYFLACNKQTPDNTIRALNLALHDLQQEGFVKSVTERYGDRTQP